jgi:hypothetical protein
MVHEPTISAPGKSHNFEEIFSKERRQMRMHGTK